MTVSFVGLLSYGSPLPKGLGVAKSGSIPVLDGLSELSRRASSVVDVW